MNDHAPPRTDLTRWNRAGLARFDYVDGDAAVWLEELRIAMLALYLRGGDDTLRVVDFWRDLYLKPKEDWPYVSSVAARVAWEKLAPSVPPQRETRGRRTERLLKQYDENSGEYAWEINRAFARATHVLLGHLNAYANEGYLRTATQWDNLRRLAAMVNYQPTPPASAITTVALELKTGTGAVAVPKGLAMKHTPAEGGPPLIFETIETVQAHPALNAARCLDTAGKKPWNQNHGAINFGKGGVAATVVWHLPEKSVLAPGDLVVVATGNAAEALSVVSVDHDTEAETAKIALSGIPAGTWPHWDTQLWLGPDDVRTGVRRSTAKTAVVEVEAGAGIAKGDIVQVKAGGKTRYVEVLAASGTEVVLDIDLTGSDTATLTPLAAYILNDADAALTATDISRMYFVGTGGVFPLDKTGSTSADGKTVGHVFKTTASRDKRGYAVPDTAEELTAKVQKGGITVISGETGKQSRTVRFAGKPPKGLANGDWFIARDIGSIGIKALRVEGVRSSAGSYYILFDAAPDGDPEATEFHGPLTTSVQARGYDRNPWGAISAGTATLLDVPVAAQALLKPGRKMILSRAKPDGTGEDILTTLSSISKTSETRVEITFEPTDAGAGWAAGDTTFRLNCAQISHGETKGSKTLGSGDGGRDRQVFDFPVSKISHIPSTATDSGVVPDIDVAVDGVRWDYRAYIDPEAEGAKAWSTTLGEDGNLKIHFRRRLPTGQNNVSVIRHRVGVGLAGTGIARLSFTKPMKKDRHVDTIHQPFQTSGGADREPVSKLRETAPSRIASNGRAVSLKDFERLARSHSSILRARAEEVPTPSATREVLLTLAPVGGGDVTQTLEETLRPAILAKAIPGVRLSFNTFETLPLHLSAKVRADLTVHDKTDLKAACETALRLAFSLENRDFGQPVYVAEVLAALETVTGVETAVATRFDLGDDYDLGQPKPPGFALPWPRNVATRDDAVAAIYPTDHQIAYVVAPGGGGALADTISIVVEDIQ